MTFNKDAWIIHAIKHRYILPQRDGTVLRCVRASKTGELLSDDYRLIAYTVHKKSGRVYFNLTWLGITKSVLVNRVIALRYLPNPDNLPQVNHVDGNKENNALYQANGSYQLEWSSGRDNEIHAHRNGLKTGRGSQNSNAKLSAAQVLEIRMQHGNGLSITDLAESFDVARSTITNIIRRKTWRHV